MGIAGLPRPIGYVLGGGGSLGAVQVGMLQALGEHDVSPDLVAGTSVGSLNGAVLALNPVSAANRLSHAWAKITRERVFPGGLLTQARILQHTKTHLFPATGLAAVIADFVGPTRRSRTLRCRSPRSPWTSPPPGRTSCARDRCGRRCWPAPRSPAYSRRCNSGRRTLVAGWTPSPCDRRWPWARGRSSAGLQLPRPYPRPARHDRRGAVLYRDGDHARPGGSRRTARRRRGAGHRPARPGAPPGVTAGFPADRPAHRDRLRGRPVVLADLNVNGPGLYGSP